MGRFLKGTLDHDGDGRMGGSRKGNNMAKKKKINHDPESYGRGRVARKRGIDRGSITPEADKKSWQAGWDYQDGIEEG